MTQDISLIKSGKKNIEISQWMLFTNDVISVRKGKLTTLDNNIV